MFGKNGLLKSHLMVDHVPRLFQRQRKRKKQEQVVQNENGEGVKAALLDLRVQFKLSVADCVSCRTPG